ncbi:hypothetical protein MJO28_001917, partial [Puccinia striiformis f. sp. tritici]
NMYYVDNHTRGYDKRYSQKWWPATGQHGRCIYPAIRPHLFPSNFRSPVSSLPVLYIPHLTRCFFSLVPSYIMASVADIQNIITTALQQQSAQQAQQMQAKLASRDEVIIDCPAHDQDSAQRSHTCPRLLSAHPSVTVNLEKVNAKPCPSQQKHHYAGEEINLAGTTGEDDNEYKEMEEEEVSEFLEDFADDTMYSSDHEEDDDNGYQL